MDAFGQAFWLYAKCEEHSKLEAVEKVLSDAVHVARTLNRSDIASKLESDLNTLRVEKLKIRDQIYRGLDNGKSK